MILEDRGGFVGRKPPRGGSGARGFGMVGCRKVDARRRGGWFRVIGLLVNLSLLLTLSTISPLSVELDGFILPDLEGVGTGSIVLICSLTLLTSPFSNISRRVMSLWPLSRGNFLKFERTVRRCPWSWRHTRVWFELWRGIGVTEAGLKTDGRSRGRTGMGELGC